MDIFFIAILSLFAVLGFVTLIKELVYGCLHPKEITLYTLNDEKNIEFLIRSLKNQFPDTVITVRDNGSSDATVEIAKRLGADIKRSE